ncbi:MAG: MBL fold metallo-hydrolase [Alphaproteobacteria bacterium]
MIFRQIFESVSSTYTYLLASRPGGEALLIDPVIEKTDHYLRLIRELDLKLVMAVDTHVHADHVTALGALRDQTRCLTVMGKKAQVDMVSMRVTEGDQIRVDDLALGVLYTPGHTNDSYSFVMPDRVFTGDTLLIRGTGRTDFQNGDPYDAYDSLFNKLLKLPDETLVYPAHDYKGDTVSSIGEERAFNPRLQVGSAEEYAEIMNGLNLPNPKMMDVAVPANLSIGMKEFAPDVAARTITADQALNLYAKPDVVFVDLREPAERDRDGAIPGSVHVPYTKLKDSLGPGGLFDALAGQMDRKLVLFCAFGERSAMALEELDTAGTLGEKKANAMHMMGGLDAWVRAGGQYILQSAGQDI